jgi:uncharacterized membrane protein YhaH (DUF805 family)
MILGESITVCFDKYAKFDGRASRSEYWWFYLFAILASLAAWGWYNTTVAGVVSFALLLPMLSVASRRLHDIDKSSWWLLLGTVPIANLVLIYWYCQKGTDGPNQYGTGLNTLG